MHKKILFMVLLTLLTATLALAGGEEEHLYSGTMHLVIATDATFPPMEFVNDRNELIGFDVDLMNAAAKACYYYSFLSSLLQIIQPWNNAKYYISSDSPPTHQPSQNSP